MSGRRSQAASTLSRLSIGSPMPMNTQWSMAVHATEAKRLLDDLRGTQIATELHLARSAERAGQRTARLRGDADRVAPVAIAHQYRLQGPPVGGREQGLDRTVARASLLAQLEARERDVLAQRTHAAGRAGSSSARSPRRPWRPTPTPGARGRGLAVRGAAFDRGALGPYPLSLQPMRLAKYLAHAGVASRRAAETHDRRRTGDRRRASRARSRA